jgi:hypothetical protein
MKILFIDIETTPILAWVWGIWQQNVGLNQIVEPTHMLCWAARWLDYSKMVFRRVGNKDFHKRLWTMLDEADVVVHYNGKSFDCKHINREFLEQGMTPPSPYKQIDLLQVIKGTFRFPSNKLAYVLKALKMEGKVHHEGFELWTKCMNDVASAWRTMKKYNIQDTNQLVDLYLTLRPWIINHPNMGIFRQTTGMTCMSCGAGAKRLQKRGFAITPLSKFQRYVCKDCGKWQRGRKNEIDRENLTTSIAR